MNKKLATKIANLLKSYASESEKHASANDLLPVFESVLINGKSIKEHVFNFLTILFFNPLLAIFGKINQKLPKANQIKHPEKLLGMVEKQGKVKINLTVDGYTITDETGSYHCNMYKKIVRKKKHYFTFKFNKRFLERNRNPLSVLIINNNSELYGNLLQILGSDRTHPAENDEHNEYEKIFKNYMDAVLPDFINVSLLNWLSVFQFAYVNFFEIRERAKLKFNHILNFIVLNGFMFNLIYRLSNYDQGKGKTALFWENFGSSKLFEHLLRFDKLLKVFTFIEKRSCFFCEEIRKNFPDNNFAPENLLILFFYSFLAHAVYLFVGEEILKFVGDYRQILSKFEMLDENPLITEVIKPDTDKFFEELSRLKSFASRNNAEFLYWLNVTFLRHKLEFFSVLNDEKLNDLIFKVIFFPDVSTVEQIKKRLISVKLPV